MSKFKDLIENLSLYRALARSRSSYEGRGRDPRWPSRRWVLGHRGARSVAPENTLTSFRMAMKFGADGVEFDVMPSRDGVPVVIHDDTLQRTTNAIGIVWEVDRCTLANLNATKLKPGFAKEGVPTLLSTLHVLPDGALVNIELKSRGHLSAEEYLLHVERDIEAHKNRLRIVVSSFDAELLKLLRKKNVTYLLALLLSKRDAGWQNAIELMSEIKPDALHISPDLATPLTRFLAHRAGMLTAIWTVNDPREAKHWFHKGIDGIFTDRVQEIVEAVRPR